MSKKSVFNIVGNTVERRESNIAAPGSRGFSTRREALIELERRILKQSAAMRAQVSKNDIDLEAIRNEIYPCERFRFRCGHNIEDEL